MTERDIARYVVMSTVFESEGWKEITVEMQDELNNVKEALLYAASDVEMYRLQGRASQLASFITLPQVVESLLQSTLAEEEA